MQEGGLLCREFGSLKGLRRFTPLLHRAEPGFDASGQLLAANPGNALHRFLNATIGPDAEADRALGHPDLERRMKGC